VDPVAALTLRSSVLRGRRAAKRRCWTVRLRVEDRPLSREEFSVSEARKYRKFTAQQETEIVLASLRGPRR
jgi:hypothetical protein